MHLAAERANDDESRITVAEGRVSAGPRKGESSRVILASLSAK